MHFLIAILAFVLSFSGLAATAEAGGPIDEFCLYNATIHAPYYCKGEHSEAFVSYDEATRTNYYARIASSAPAGLTPLFNTIEIVSEHWTGSSIEQTVVGRLVLKYQFSPKLHTLVSSGTFVVALGEINPRSEGFLVIDTSDLKNPKLRGGVGAAGSGLRSGEWSFISSYFTWADDRILLAVNYESASVGSTIVTPGHRAELVEYRMKQTGNPSISRIMRTDDRIDAVISVWPGNDLLVLTTDPARKTHRTYLTEDLEFIGSK